MYSKFQKLFHSKAIETVDNFLVKNSLQEPSFVKPLLNHFETKAQKVFLKYEKQEKSKKNLKRISTELEKEWKSSLDCTLDKTCTNIDKQAVKLQDSESVVEDQFDRQGLKEATELVLNSSLKGSQKSLVKKGWSVANNLVVSFQALGLLLATVLESFKSKGFLYTVYSPLFFLVSTVTAPVGNYIGDGVATFGARTLSRLVEETKKVDNTGVVSFFLSESFEEPASDIAVAFFVRMFKKFFQNEEIRKFYVNPQQISADFATGVVSSVKTQVVSRNTLVIGSLLLIGITSLITLVVKMIWSFGRDNSDEI